ncbi:MAG: type II toxin-antitoxin system prevent-host-death family antitoxin [bacterium]|nr:type II toxin-antitoxin system prevent-host-death family antitoxin [bacterium]MDZ4247662.1 type II toxin-antitoxin system prevent-host-death family antitoxin [Patescibacteria group bacterium]
MTTIGIKEFQQHASRYSKEVQQGKSFIVYSRSKPVMKLVPVDEGDWETLIDFTKFRKGGIPLSELEQKLKALD